jgi:hypothetical protein
MHGYMALVLPVFRGDTRYALKVSWIDDEAGLDTELARCWTLLRAVDYQLWGLNLGLTEDPARCATVIDWLSLAP